MNGGSSRPEKRQKRDEEELDGPNKCCLIRINASNNETTRSLESSPPEAAASGDRSLLQELISPLNPDLFLDQHFRNTAVHIASPAPGTFRAIREDLYNLNPREILSNTSSEAIFVWLSMPGKKQIQSIEVSDADTALALCMAGHATYCRAPPSLEQHLVSSLLKDTGLGCGQYDPTGESMTCLGRGEVEVFMAPRGHITEWHCDFQENFTLQLSGTKKWSLQRSTVKHPLRGCTPHYNSPESVEPQLKAGRLADPNFKFGEPAIGKNAIGDVETVILKPGDVLYHPAGIWHKVEAMDEGVSINISLMAANYAALTCQSLQHFLMKRDDWRQCLFGGRSGNPRTSAIDTLRSLVRELPKIVEEFEKTVGADGILPPALRAPAPMTGDEASNDEDVESIEGRKENGNTGYEEEHDDGEKVMDDDEDEEGDDIIDADAFQCPQGSASIKFEDSVELATNPLAMIVDENDIQNFYKTNRKEDAIMRGDSNGEGVGVRVLNVNYAGIESQESLMRIRLQSSNWKQMQNFLDRQRGIVPEEIRPLVSCMFYYGYLLCETAKK